MKPRSVERGFILELELISQTYHVAVGLEVVLVVTHRLVAVEETEGVLFGHLPVEARLETGLLQTPGIEELDAGIRCHSEPLLIILHLQTATEHVSVLAFIDLPLAVIGIVEIAPALVDDVLRTVSVLPAFAQGEPEIAEELLVEGCRDIETVASSPVLGALLGIAGFSITVEHLIVEGIKIRDPLVVVIEERVSGRELQPFGGLIVETQTRTPTVYGLGIVAGTEFTLETEVHDLGELLLRLKREIESEVIRLGC